MKDQHTERERAAALAQLGIRLDGLIARIQHETYRDRPTAQDYLLLALEDEDIEAAIVDYCRNN